MSGELVIRDACESDLAAITAIYAEHVLRGTGTFEIEPPDATEMSRRVAAVGARGLPWLVALVDGEVAGYAYASPFRARPAYDWLVEDSIYTAHRSIAAGGRGWRTNVRGPGRMSGGGLGLEPANAGAALRASGCRRTHRSSPGHTNSHFHTKQESERKQPRLLFPPLST
ncbi:MAG: N-acetyltransferase family protein [Planctomycetota bacterium]|nr:N-acetyltransferase family protein [Planctomycetota bacterium]